MNKLFTLLTLILFSIQATAVEYKDSLVVSMSTSKTKMENVVINVEKQPDGKYTFALNNFVIDTNGSKTGVGNIVLKDLEATKDEKGIMNIKADKNVNITPGNVQGITFWLGSILESVLIHLEAQFTDNKLYANITLTTMGMNINVIFGNNKFPEKTSVKSIEQEKETGDKIIYNLNGQPVRNMQHGQAYIIKVGKKTRKAIYR